MRYPASAIGLPAHAWHKITWREGTAEPLSSRFARVRVRLSHRDYWLAECRHEEWLLIEWLRARQHQPNIGFQRLRSTLYFVGWSILQQAALAHRARLPRTQIGVWPWSLRGAKLAWLPRPRNIVHCRLRISSLRARDESLSETAATKPSRKLLFPKPIGRGDPPLRPERHVPNSIATVR